MLEILTFVLFAIVEAHLGEAVHPLTKEWVYHYAEGSQADKWLPSAYQAPTRKAVIEAIKLAISEPSYEGMSTARVDDSVLAADGWFKGLSGVVGSFKYKLIPTPWDLRVVCEDVWDFNPAGMTSGKIHVPVKKFPALVKLLVKKLTEKTTFVYYKNDHLVIDEEWLAQFNKTHEFTTRWEFTIQWDELGIPKRQDQDQDASLPNGWCQFQTYLFDWEKGGLPVEWLKCKAAEKRIVDRRHWTVYKDGHWQVALLSKNSEDLTHYSFNEIFHAYDNDIDLD